MTATAAERRRQRIEALERDDDDDQPAEDPVDAESRETNELSDDFLRVDKYHLDEEWERQPRLYFQWARKAADARAAVAEAKAALEVAEAEVYRAVRAAPVHYGIDGRVTEDQIKAAVVLQPKYQRALKALNDAKHAVDILDAAVSALDHKKRSLEGEVQLFLASYYAAPREPRHAETTDAGRSMEERTKERVRRRGQVRANHE